VTTPEKKQDGTIELDVGQIDLLDLPLPPSSKPAGEAAPVSKGPPPLPPAFPDEQPGAPPDAPAPAPAAPAAAAPAPAGALSARKLLDGPPPPPQRSPMLRFLVGMGAASLVCAGLWFAFRALHKAPPPPAPSATPAATHAFTMAPIEFTDPVASDSASASAAPAASTPPAPASAGHHSSAGHVHSGQTSKPTALPPPTAHAGDDVLKVEN
jgi:hypothetical protein